MHGVGPSAVIITFIHSAHRVTHSYELWHHLLSEFTVGK